MREFRNWAGNQSVVPAEVRTPSSVEEVVRAVRDAAAAGRRVRMTGTGHSFTGAALTDGLLLRPDGLTGILQVGDGRVTAAAGTPLRVLNEELHRMGLALANMGDITAQTLAGAIQTGTHGTGRDVGGLADQVLALEMVLAGGEVVTVRADAADRAEQDLFDAARVGLGALGVLTAVTFRVEPSFLLRSTRQPMALSEILGSLDALTSGNEHLDFFWLPHTDTCLTKRNNRSTGPADPPGAFKRWLDNTFLENTLFGALCGIGARLPGAIPRINALSAAALSASACTDTSYKIFTSVREVRFLEMEYAIPREHLGQALRETRDLIELRDWKIGFPVEVRVTPASDAWLSTAYGRDTAYLACHIYRPTPHPEYFEGVEEIMTRLGGRPHWGKLHTRDAAYLDAVYPRFADFLALRDRLDPERLFANDYLDGVLGP
ncbi:D-arabinono-1,4-lactone oxidase [Planomonospora parontospora]|uniref:D-arabinono-1,4-lactone oxidase n=1 Tax=Planomonospora parontospora TaxID=58119 RepID=UPI00167045FD|nr:D-arabinono-1,4-lactone oxidase [Planomonospora parontospora]GGL26874.1 FAD-linked oxidoreductase [Planomonospora parontospora subsp. antibiotica]GII16153.1 FAD-linked oxidoreductase [Planomonospora parontospora subsp. antibiotica]